MGCLARNGTEAVTAPLLRVTGVSKRFAGQPALEDFTLTLEPGQVHALVGHNGSGKSTFVKLLCGFHRPEAGAEAWVGDEAFVLGDAQAARRAGLRFVHQDLGLVGSLPVVDNVVLGEVYPTRRLRTIDWAVARRQVADLLADLGYDIDPRRPVDRLSLIERTGVAIARALRDGENARVLVLDEPTAALPADAVERLFAVVRRLRDQGLAILYISHHLDEVSAIADQVTVLRDGRKVATRQVNGLPEDELVELIVGHTVEQQSRPPEPPSPPIGTAALSVRDLRAGALRRLDLDVAPGEVVGVAGVAGSGRDDLAGALFGAAPRLGTVSVAGRVIPAERPEAAISSGLGLLPADRAHTGLVPNLGVAQNLTLARLEASCRGLLLRRRRERCDSLAWLERLDVRPCDPSKPIEQLSGGNQQKVLLGRWLRAGVDVLIVDEPTQGVDVGSVEQIHELIRARARRGTAFVVCSSDTDELVRLCHRVVVLNRGLVVDELRGAAIGRDAIDRLCLRTTTRNLEAA